MKNTVNVCVVGIKTTFSPFDFDNHYQLFLRLINDPQISRCMLREGPAYRSGTEKWFETLPHHTDIVFAINDLSGKPIGVCGFEKISSIHRTAETWIILDPDNQQKGCGTDAKMHLLDYGFNYLNLRKIYALVISHNEPSIKHNIRCGFKEIARLPDRIIQNAEMYDLIYLENTRDQFLQVFEKYKTSAITP